MSEAVLKVINGYPVVEYLGFGIYRVQTPFGLGLITDENSLDAVRAVIGDNFSISAESGVIIRKKVEDEGGMQ